MALVKNKPIYKVLMDVSIPKRVSEVLWQKEIGAIAR